MEFQTIDFTALKYSRKLRKEFLNDFEGKGPHIVINLNEFLRVVTNNSLADQLKIAMSGAKIEKVIEVDEEDIIQEVKPVEKKKVIRKVVENKKDESEKLKKSEQAKVVKMKAN